MPGDNSETYSSIPSSVRAGPTPLSLTLSEVTVGVGSIDICSEVSLMAESGQVVGIVGPNGSGKTTLLRAVYRVLRPQIGRAHV